MKKGFTLIELLAVIVILAIIALIATPIVLNIIEESKENANLRSAEFYLDAVELAVANKNLEEAFSPFICTILSDGNLQCGSEVLEVEVDGEVPTSGTITFDGGKISSYANMNIGEKYLTKTTTSTEIEVKDQAGKVLSNTCVAAKGSSVTTGNEATGSFANGDEYICEVKDGVLYNFFVISTEGDNVNLIMDRNVAADGTPATAENLSQVAWCSKEDYDAKNAEETAAGTSDGVDAYLVENPTYCGSSTVMTEEGAITALDALKLYVSSWDNLEDKTYTDSIVAYTIDTVTPGVIYEADPEVQSNDLQKAIWTPYSLNHTMKARLMTAAEALANGCKYEINEVVDGVTIKTNVYPNSCPLYLANYLSHGEKFVSGDKVVDIANLKGYWLSTGGGCSAYLVHNNGSINVKAATTSNHSGIRPVITLAKTDLG